MATVIVCAQDWEIRRLENQQDLSNPLEFPNYYSFRLFHFDVQFHFDQFDVSGLSTSIEIVLCQFIAQLIPFRTCYCLSITSLVDQGHQGTILINDATKFPRVEF